MFRLTVLINCARITKQIEIMENVNYFISFSLLKIKRAAHKALKAGLDRSTKLEYYIRGNKHRTTDIRHVHSVLGKRESLPRY